MERSANRMFDMDQNRINEGGSLGRMREEWINAAATQEVERQKVKVLVVLLISVLFNGLGL